MTGLHAFLTVLHAFLTVLYVFLTVLFAFLTVLYVTLERDGMRYSVVAWPTPPPDLLGTSLRIGPQLGRGEHLCTASSGEP